MACIRACATAFPVDIIEEVGADAAYGFAASSVHATRAPKAVTVTDEASSRCAVTVVSS